MRHYYGFEYLCARSTTWANSPWPAGHLSIFTSQEDCRTWCKQGNKLRQCIPRKVAIRYVGSEYFNKELELFDIED